MLEFFLGEAEEFFENSEPGASISSGVWVEELEDGGELPLLASARELPNAKLILIQAVREEYAERVRILRKARADILERRNLAGALNSSKKQDLSLYCDWKKVLDSGRLMPRMTNVWGRHVGDSSLEIAKR